MTRIRVSRSICRKFAFVTAAGAFLLMAAVGCEARQVVEERSEVTLYFAVEDEGRCYLKAAEREVPASDRMELAALEELIKGPVTDSPLEPVLPRTASVLDIEVAEGSCIVDFSREIITDAAALDPTPAIERLALGAIANTLTEFDHIDSAVILIEGMREGNIDGLRVEEFWGFEGLPGELRRDEALIGPPGLERDPPPEVPAWKQIDKQAIAESLGWGEVTTGSPGRNRIAVTFDAGASGQPTPAILDTLEDEGVHVTFFLTGQFMDSYPELVVRMADEGHELANHSYTHPDFTGISADEARYEIRRTEDRTRQLTGLSTRPYFRFPYGSRNRALVELVNAEGYLSVFWSVDTLDWMPESTPQSIMSRVVEGAKPGAVVLMHCGSPQAAQILPDLIRELRSMGYEIVTLTEALGP